MATNTKRSNGRAWKNERASVNKKGKSRPKSNKYSKASDNGKRPKAGDSEQYWRAGYTRKDGTKVKGHYVKRPTLIEKIKNIFD
ncbi:MAG TPA: hypothetical protein VFY66_03845 [Anaerolineales bacterium]|nr:hypothetical protein [Anaerolineales bacterium]